MGNGRSRLTLGLVTSDLTRRQGWEGRIGAIRVASSRLSVDVSGFGSPASPTDPPADFGEQLLRPGLPSLACGTQQQRLVAPLPVWSERTHGAAASP